MRRRNTVVVLAPLQLEFLEIRAHLQDLRVDRYGQTVADVGRVPGSDWFVALVAAGEGNAASNHAATVAIERYQPRAVLLIGIAGSLKDDIHIGDVVVATFVHAYHGAKVDKKGSHIRPRGWDADQALLQEARLVARQNPSQQVHFKPIASGEVVLNSREAPLREQLHHHFNDASAIDLESAGIAAACALTGHVPFLSIRGISDEADGEKHLSDAQGLQPKAAAKAAAFGIELIRGLPMRPPVDEPGRLGAKVVEAKLRGAVTSLCFGPGDTVLAAADTGPIRRWRLDGTELPELAARSWPPPRYGTRVAASHYSDQIVVRDGFELHNTEGTKIGSVTYPGYLDAASTGRYAITSWATWFALWSENGKLAKFNAVTTSMSADSRWLAVAVGLAGGGRQVHVHHLEQGRELARPEHRTIELHQAAGRAVQIALSPDGSLLGCVTARWAGIYDVRSGEPIKPRSGDNNMMTQTFPEAMGLLCTPAGHLLWMSRGRVLQLRGNKRDDLPALPQRSSYHRIAISVDGTHLATGDSSGWMRVWRWHE